MAIKRDPEGRKAQILAAATREFAVSGYGGGRVDAIAAAAGVNKRLLYHYFGDKSALFDAVVTRQLRYLRSFLNAAGDTTADSAERFAASQMALTDSQLPTLWRLLAWDARRDDPTVTLDTLQQLLGESPVTSSRQREVVALHCAVSVLQAMLPSLVRHLLGAEGDLATQLKSIEARLLQPLGHKPRVKLRPAHSRGK